LGEKGFDIPGYCSIACLVGYCLASLHDRPGLRSTISVRHWSPQSVISPGTPVAVTGLENQIIYTVTIFMETADRKK